MGDRCGRGYSSSSASRGGFQTRPYRRFPLPGGAGWLWGMGRGDACVALVCLHECFKLPLSSFFVLRPSPKGDGWKTAFQTPSRRGFFVFSDMSAKLKNLLIVSNPFSAGLFCFLRPKFMDCSSLLFVSNPFSTGLFCFPSTHVATSCV